MKILKLNGMTMDNRDFSTVWEQTTIFICKNFETWKNIIAKFNYFVNRANAIGYYSNYDFVVEIREMKETRNHELYPEKLILRMDKKQYQKYKDIYNYPYVPMFNENLTALDKEDQNDCYEICNYDLKKKEYNKTHYPQFENEWDTWEYIFQNDLIK